MINIMIIRLEVAVKSNLFYYDVIAKFSKLDKIFSCLI
jgi:hypothetical protein